MNHSNNGADMLEKLNELIFNKL